MIKDTSKDQNAFLYSFNPYRKGHPRQKNAWIDLERGTEELQNGGKFTQICFCLDYKKVKVGDRAFFLASQRGIPQGIVASGYIVSEPFQAPTGWERGVSKEIVYGIYVDVELDTIINPQKESILQVSALPKMQKWPSYAGGISINPNCIIELEQKWAEHLSFIGRQVSQNRMQIDDSIVFQEGDATQVVQTRYERNPHARKVCLEHYGFSCFVCGFNFTETYGELGAKFIHVHHLIQIADIGETYTINPIVDLRPVCPNCHSMLHRKKPSLTIEELKQLIKQ